MSPRRQLALLSILAVVISLLTLAVTPAAEAARPSLTAGPAVSGRPVVLAGSGARRGGVVLQRKAHGHWVKVRKARVDRAGRFTVRARVTLGAQKFRALAGGRASRAVTVKPAPAVTRVGDAFAVSGRLPSTRRRGVELQRQDGSRWMPVARTTTRRKFRLTWLPTETTTVRVVAPRAVRITGARGTRKRTVLPAVASTSVRLNPAPPTPAGPTPTKPDPVDPDPTEPTDPEQPETPEQPGPVTYTDLTPAQQKGATQPHLSADGRYVAFMSSATLDEDDDNLAWDIYVHDRVNGSTELASKDATTGLAVGALDPAISADGRYVAFVTGAADVVAGQPAQPAGQVYLYDRQAGTAKLASAAISGQPDAGSWAPTVSAHGEYVAFTSNATNLATAADTNGMSDVFRRAMGGAQTRLVSAKMGDPTKSGDSASWQASISADGSRVAYVSLSQNLAANAVPNVQQIYRWDQSGPQSLMVSVRADHENAADGPSGLPSISADGSAIAFISTAKNLGLTNPSGRQQVHLWREADNGTTPISTVDTVGGNWHSDAPAISGDGTRVAFVTAATDLVPGMGSSTTSVVMWGPTTGLRNVSLDPDGEGPDDDSFAPSLDSTGHVLAFASEAGDIAPGDGVQGVAHVLVAVVP